MNLRQEYTDFAIKHMNLYVQNQAVKSGLSKDTVVEYFWFTIKPSAPTGKWEQFQYDYEKLVQKFHKSLCMNTIGKHYDRDKNKHLKPFICAAPDYENSNNSNPQYKNSFNHVHGIIALQGEQLKLFKTLIKENGAHYHYKISVGEIRDITIGKINNTEQDLYNYTNYISKNTNRQSRNETPIMMIPNQKSFKDYINEKIPPHQDGSRLRKTM